jgi:hypothetical protein
VTGLIADERIYSTVVFEPYTPAHHFEGRKADPKFRAKLKTARGLVERVVEEVIPFTVVVANSFYGEAVLEGVLRDAPPQEPKALLDWVFSGRGLYHLCSLATNYCGYCCEDVRSGDPSCGSDSNKLGSRCLLSDPSAGLEGRRRTAGRSRM